MGIIKIIFKTIGWVIRSVFIFLGLLFALSLMNNRVGDFTRVILQAVVRFITTRIWGY